MKKCLLIFCLIPAFSYAQEHEVIDSLRSLAAKEQSDSVRIELLTKIGQTYGSSRADSAMKYYQKADELNRPLKNPFLQMKLERGMAAIYSHLGNYSEALKLSFAVMKKAREINDKKGVLFATREVMWVYGNIGDFQKRLAVAKQMDSLVKSGYFAGTTELNTSKMMVYNVLAINYQDLKMLDSAYHYRSLLYQYASKLNDIQGLALATAGLGDFHRNAGNIDSAFYYYWLCIPYIEKALRFDVKRQVEFDIAKLYKEKKQIDSAFYYAYKSLNEYGTISDSAKIMDVAFLMSDLHHLKRREDSAYFYLSYYNSLRERALNTENIQKAQDLLFNETLQQQRLEQQRREAQQQYESKIKILSLMAGGGVLLLLTVVLYRNNRQQQKANRQINYAYKELKNTQAQLIQSEKMASLGELTAGIAHEIQNPLNFVNNFSEINKELLVELKDEADKGNVDEVKVIANDVIENSEKINHHGKRADAIVKGMLQHSRSNSGQKEPTDINALADEYLRLAYHGLRAKDNSFNAVLKTDYDHSIGNINIIPQDIGRVILNLITNAFYAVDEKKKQQPNDYEPSVFVSTKKMGAKVLISVKDNGNGISKKILEKIFQPFFTTKPTGQGTGLGLSLAYDIVIAQGGELKVETKESEYTEFIIHLPLP